MRSCLNCLLFALMLALGSASTVNGQDKKLPLPADEVKTPAPAAPTKTTKTDKVELSDSMTKLKAYLDDAGLSKCYYHSKYSFSVIVPLNKLEDVWSKNAEVAVATKFAEEYKMKKGPFVKKIIGIAFVTTQGKNFEKVVYTVDDLDGVRRSVGVPFPGSSSDVTVITDEMIKLSEADEVLKTFTR